MESNIETFFFWEWDRNGAICNMFTITKILDIKAKKTEKGRFGKGLIEDFMIVFQIKRITLQCDPFLFENR